MGSTVLTGKVFHVKGTWNEPKRHLLKAFRTVVHVEYTDTTSSAGDWNGLLIQRLGNRLHVLEFYQSNSWPSDGFDVTIGDEVAVLEGYDGSVPYSILLDDYRECM